MPLSKKTFLNCLNHAHKGRDFLLDLIFPVYCIGCKSEGRFICGECQAQVRINEKMFCPNCHKDSNTGEYCPSCQTNTELNGLWISADYHQRILSEAIKGLKYKGNKNLAPWLGGLLATFFETSVAAYYPDILVGSLIIPVPLHKKRERTRGFNQSRLIAEIFSKKINLKINSSGLKRIRETKAQAKLKRSDRLKNVQDAFVWCEGPIKTKNIILIDDVSSTGATLSNCAKTLRQNGAEKIWGLVLARN
jgi:ComF family protein